MDFRFEDEHRLLQETLATFLEKEHPPARVRALWETATGRSRELWARLAEIGVPGLLVPEEHGGLGLDEVAMVLLQEECGRAALAEPVISTAAVAAPLLRELGGSAAARWLPAVAAGEAIVAVALPGLPFVSDLHVADLLLFGERGRLRAIAPGAARATAQPANDPSRRLFSVEADPDAGEELARGEQADRLLADAFARGALAAAAQLVGVCRRLLDLAVSHASQREQFGRPIGAFQAVKHMLADVAVKLEYARPQVYRAAWSVARAAPLRDLHVSMAKDAAGQAALFAARRALQVHGAIGYTWEHDLHIFMRRAWSLERAYGRSRLHHDRMVRAVMEEGVPIGPGATFGGESS